MSPAPGDREPTAVYVVLGAVGLFIVSRLPLAAIAGGLIRLALSLVRPALLVLGLVHVGRMLIPEPREETLLDLESATLDPTEDENVVHLVERGRQMGF